MDISSATHLFRFRGDNINTINELVNNIIWHSKYAGLNDPFEMFFQLDDSGLEKLPLDDIAKILAKTRYLAEQREYIQRCFMQKDMVEIYEHIRQYWGESFIKALVSTYQKGVAVACFTKTYDSRLMWGYYGNGMKGICFVYNKQKLLESGLEIADVIYSDEAPKIDTYKHLVERLRGRPLTVDALFSLRKHNDWINEQEVRSLKYLEKDEVYEHQPGIAVPLSPGCIDAIILGERLAGDMRSFVEAYAKKNDIHLLIAKADFTSYKVKIEG
ncbi:DUF2971 domain-containing protein [Enterobacter sp. Ap-1006]|uniref:DUF2971 domain-containing protein n=1 Tax=Enterobacter sp. Ap-1006 TaxID=2608345 RepID=UPI00141F97C8|nr:DUF2971 domain-containing protein [Enterobacter sp. Ap-1006]NIF50112.1 DUF2971 domain-containing protein [Enterobacter sp. Ap-1006]